ncbi:MAG: hypothetical protein ABI318_16790 [Chthoniobacteraceae bacterium]
MQINRGQIVQTGAAVLAALSFPSFAVDLADEKEPLIQYDDEN